MSHDDHRPDAVNDDAVFDEHAVNELADFAESERDANALRSMMQIARDAHDAPVDPASVDRQRRALLLTIAERSRGPRFSGRSQAAAALMVAAFAGAAVAYTAMTWEPAIVSSPVTKTTTAPAAVHAPEQIDEVAPAVDDAPVVDAVVATAPTPAVSKRRRAPKKRSVQVARGTPTPRSVANQLLAEAADAPLGDPRHLDAGDAAAMAGLVDEATDAYVNSLVGAGGNLARRRLIRMTSDGLTTPNEIAAKIRRTPRIANAAAAQKMLCEWTLANGATRSGLETCQRFVESNPTDRDAKLLATTAGRAAQQIGELKLANTLLTRAVMMSEYAGVSTADALLARAHVLKQMGDLAQAAADLRMYVHLVPESRRSTEINALAGALNVDLSE